jgi:hypothetical protein
MRTGTDRLFLRTAYDEAKPGFDEGNVQSVPYWLGVGNLFITEALTARCHSGSRP